MRIQSKKKLYMVTLVTLLFLNLLIPTQLLFAGTTGKIAGKVIDKTTRQPLYGVTVVVQGTRLGGVTDPEGEFHIINIPPGIYNLKLSMVGYTAQTLEKIRVQVDLTTHVDAELASTALQLNQDVVVTANKQIQKDITSSERTVQSDQIQNLPVRDVETILSLQAGINRDAGGNLHIRGGRSSEITYLVDGVQVMDPVNRKSGISIDDQSIEELKAISGTFNAEYGQALSGVVNIVTKKGSDVFTVNATGYVGDNLSFDNSLYKDMSNQEWADAVANSLIRKSGYLDFDFSKYGFNSYRDVLAAVANNYKPWETSQNYLKSFDPFKRIDAQLNISGPISDGIKNVSYYIAGRYQYSPSYQMGRRYFMPWGLWQPVSDTVHHFTMPDGKQVPLGWYRGISTQAKLFWNLPGLDLSYGLYYNNDNGFGAYSKYEPDGGKQNFTDRYTQILSATWILSNDYFIDFRGSQYVSTYKDYLYENPYDYRYVPTSAGDFMQWMFNPQQGSDILVAGGQNYDFPFWGNDASRSNNRERYYSFSTDLTGQVNKYNMIKVGASGRFHDLSQEYYTLQFDQTTYRPIVPDHTSPYNTYYAAKPKEFAAYVQDKIEFDELIINAGLRYDYFNSDGQVLADPSDPQIYSPFKEWHIYKNWNPNWTPAQVDSFGVPYTIDERRAFWYKKATPKAQLSPRFGLSFPISAGGVIHFSYGHFFQTPGFNYLYANPNYWISGAGSSQLVGNANLQPERTVMYELGLQQQVTPSIFLHVTGFYRDIRDWVGIGVPTNTYANVTYVSYVNKDNATAKGITLSGSYNVDNLSVNLDYTYMQAMGTSSNATDAYNSMIAGIPPQLRLVYLNWDQTHNVNLVVNYKLNDWFFTLIGNLSSGFPYTPSWSAIDASSSAGRAELVENSERAPSTYNLDLRISRTVIYNRISCQFMLDIKNLLDTRNARYVYSDTGLPGYTFGDINNRNRLVEISNSTENVNDPGRYSDPRYISFGIRLGYK